MKIASFYCYAFFSGGGDQRFKSGPVKMDAVLPMARHRCDIFFKRSCVAQGAMTRRWVPQTRYTLWRNTASIMKDMIGCFQPKIKNVGKNYQFFALEMLECNLRLRITKEKSCFYLINFFPWMVLTKQHSYRKRHQQMRCCFFEPAHNDVIVSNFDESATFVTHESVHVALCCC